jgi:hypothetical protein
LSHVVSYLAYPNLLGTKRLGCWLLVVVGALSAFYPLGII